MDSAAIIAATTAATRVATSGDVYVAPYEAIMATTRMATYDAILTAILTATDAATSDAITAATLDATRDAIMAEANRAPTQGAQP